MYRNDREALIAKLDQLAVAIAKRESEVAAVRGELERRRALDISARRGRHRPYLIALALLLALSPLAYVRYTSALPHVQRREARRAQLEARFSSVSREIDARRDLVTAQGDRYREPPEVTPELSSLYGELRFLNATSASEAWLIVGSVSCARRDDATADRARRALPEETRPRLDVLCAPWRPAP